DPRFDPSTPGLITGGTVFNLDPLLVASFREDERVIYDNGGSPSIGGLPSVEDDPNAIYYVHIVGPGAIQLKTAPGGSTSGSGTLACTGSTVCGLTAPSAANRGESHRFVPTDQGGVREDTSPRFNPQNGIDVNTATDTITLPYNIGIGTDDQVLYSSGDGQAIGGLVDGQTYYAKNVVSTLHSTQLQLAATKGGATIDLTSTGTGTSHSIVRGGDTPSSDASETGPRVITPKTTSVGGVAVTASNSDDLAVVGVSAGFSGTAAVNLSGAVAVVTAKTSAYIGKNAVIDSGGDVKVAAGNQYHEISVAATLAIGGTAGVGVGVGVHLVTLNVDAFIDDSASVTAGGNVAVIATGQDSIIAVVAGAAGGEVGVAGTVGVTILHVHTFASTGTNVTIVAGNNVLVSAQDDTKLVLVTASVAGGYVGVGVAVGVASVTKDTEAFIGAGANVDAKATGAAIDGVYDGNVTGDGDFETASYNGLAVQSASSENVFGLSASAGGGFVGVAGGVGVTLLHVTTQAFIGNGTTATSDNGSVNVAAVDAFRSLTVAGGAAGGFVGVAGGVDIGIADSSVAAYIGVGSIVNAAGDVGVFGLSTKNVQTYALSIGGGFVGVAGSVSVWTIGTDPVTSYNDAAGGPDKGVWSSGAHYNKGDVVTFGGKKYAARVDNPSGDPVADPSEWDGGTNALASTTDKGTWTNGTDYAKGDVVQDPMDSKYYGATVDHPNTSMNPSTNLGQWQIAAGPGQSAQGSADAAASGNDESGGPGYKSILGGASASSSGPAPAWASGSYSRDDKVGFGGDTYTARRDITSTGAWSNSTTYHLGQIVTFDGKDWAAQVDSPTVGADPETNSAQWQLDDPGHDRADWQLNSASDAKTNSRVASALSSPTTTLTSAAPTGNVASDALAAHVPAGTSAQIQAGSTVVAGRGVHVRAKDNLSVTGIAGSVAGGFVGVGAAVLVMNVDSATEASIGPGSSVTAGSGGSGDVAVEASMKEDVFGLAFAGTGGFVALGAQVVVLNDTGTQNAHIDNGSAIHQAGGGVLVTTTADRTIDVESIGGSTGAFTTGASVATSNVSGDATASVGNVLVGDLNPVASLNVTVTDSISAPTKAIAVEAGIGAGLGGAIAFSSLVGTTSATSGAHGTVGSGGVTVSATGNHTAKANTVNVSTGILAAGVTVAHVSESRATLATVTSTGAISTTGAVLVAATATNEAEATAPGGAGGGVAIDILIPIAEVSGNTNAEVDGSFTGASSITVQAHASNHADAEVEVIGVSVIGLSGAFAHATVSGNVQASVGSGVTLDTTGAVLVEAELVGPKQATAEAHATAGSFGAIGSLSIMDTQATVSGNLVANLAGNVTGSSSITVRAQGANTATADTLVVGIGSYAGAGGGAGAEIDGNTNATSGAGSWISTGLVLVTATSDNNATASADIGTGGLISIGVSLPSATVNGATTAELAADVDPTAVEVHATSNNDATASSTVVAIGLLGGGSGTEADATIGTGAVTNALVDSSSTIDNAASIEVLATSDNNATANIPGGGGGAVNVTIMVPTALVEGATKAHLDGDVTNGGTLLVRSRTSNTATATSHVISIALLGGAIGITSDAEVTSAATSEASVGSTASVVLIGNATIEADQTAANTAIATASGTGTGLIQGGVYQTKAIVGAATLAAVDGSVTSAALIVGAVGGNTATSSTKSVSIGALSFSGAGALAQVTNTADVTARTSATSHAHGSVLVAAISTNTATAISDAASGSLAIALAVNLPTAKVGGATVAEFDGSADTAAVVFVLASSTNTATATADIFSIGLLGAGAGASSDAEVTADATTQALVGATATIDAPGGAITVSAISANNAAATADGAGGAIGVSVDIMKPTAIDAGGTSAVLNGDVTNSGSLTVRTRTADSASAHTHIVNITLLGSVSGGFANATIASSAGGRATIGSASEITVTGAVLVDAGQTAPSTATATADGDGTGFISAGVFFANASVGGATVAELDGTVHASASVTVQAAGANGAEGNTKSFGLGGFAISGAGVDAEVTSTADVNAIVGTGTIASTGAIAVTATSTNTANATSDAANGGLVAGGITVPTAKVSGGTTAEFGANVTSGTTLAVTAKGTNVATSHTAIISIGLLAGNGAAADAEVTAAAVVDAFVDAGSVIAVTGEIDVTSTGLNLATATPTSAALSAISISILLPTAKIGASTKATMDGTVSTAQSLHVIAQGQDTAIATADMDNFGLLFSGSGASADAEILTGADIVASVAASASISVTNEVLVEATVANNCRDIDVKASVGQQCNPPGNLAQARITSTGGGFIQGGIYFAKALDGGAVSASLDGSVFSSTSVSVLALGKSTADARSSSFGLGLGFSVSVAEVDAEVTSQARTSAELGSGLLVPPVILASSFIIVGASATNLANAFTDAANIGIAAGGVGVPTAKVSAPTTAELGAHVGSVQVTVDAIANNTANATSALVTAGLIAGGGASVDAEVTSSADTNAIVDESAFIVAFGDVTIEATSSDHATAAPSSAAASLFGISVLLATAKVGSGTLAYMDGDALVAGDLLVQARGQNIAKATSDLFQFSLAGVQGASSDAEILAGADVVAEIGKDAVDAVAGTVTVDAGLTLDGSGHGNFAAAETESTGVGLISAGIFFGKALVGGAVTAELDGSVGGSSVLVTATGHNDAVADTNALNIGGFASITGSGVDAEVTSSGDVNARTGAGLIVSTGSVIVFASANNTATATTNAANGGLVAIGVSVPTAKVNGSTQAQLNADVANAASVVVQASATNTATADTALIAVGLFSGGGAAADAEVTSVADVSAGVGDSSTINIPGSVLVTASSVDHASATPTSAAVGAIAISFLLPTAKVGGATTANFDGQLIAGFNLTVRSRSSNIATATADLVNFNIGGVSGAVANAEIQAGADVVAGIGADATVAITGAVLVDAGQTTPNLAPAETHSTGVGIISGGVFFATSKIGGAVTARLDGSVSSASQVTVQANGSNQATADTNALNIGFGFSLTGSGVEAQVTSTGDVNAFVGSTAHITTTGSLAVSATSFNLATATTNTAGGGLISGGVNAPTALLNGGTTADFDGTVDSATKGFSVTAIGTNIATATSQIISIGLLGGVGIGVSDAEIGSGAVVQSLIGPDAFVILTGVPVSVTASSTDVVTANSGGGVGGAGLTITGMSATARVGGGTWASIASNAFVETGTLKITATSNLSATATDSVTNIGAISGSGESPTSSVTHLTQAFIGKNARVSLTSSTATVSATSTASSIAQTTGTAIGAIQISTVDAEATLSDTTQAFVDDGATVLAGTLTVQATATNTPTATANSTNIGLLSGAGATTRASDTSAVHAFIGPVEGTFAADAVGNPTLVETRNDVNVLATLTSHPYSNASMVGVGVLAGGVGMSSFATAKPRVDAYLGDGAQVFADGNVVFRAVGTVTAIADGEGFGASLGFSVGEISSRADLEPIVRALTTNRGMVEGDDVTFDARLNVDSGNNPISPTYKGGSVDPAYATLTLGSVAILAGITAGGVSAIDSPTVSTFVAGATTIFSLGTVTVWSQDFSPASADGRSLSIGIGVGIGIVAPTATAAGTVTSEVDGTISEAGTVIIENTVESRTTVIGRSAAGGVLAGISDATLTANTQANVDARVRGSITASGNVTVESFVLSSALADYAGIQLSLGFSGGFITANATDSTHAGVEVYGGAHITSQFGGIALLAFHNFDGSSTFLTSNTVKAIAQITSAALGAAFNSSNLNATAQANVTSQLDPGATLDAAGKVTVGAASGNFATASMENASGAIINLGSVGSNPIADVRGHTEANLLGNVVGPGNTAGANSILLAAEGSDSATVSMSNVGGGALSISSSDSTSRGTPTVSSTLGSGGSIVITTGDITGTALSYTGSSSSTSSGTGGALNVNDFSADASMDPTVTFTVNGGSTTTSQFGTVSLGATHNESPNTFASASGGGGGFINVGSGTSGSREHLTIANTVYGVVNGVDVNITTHGNVLVEGHTDNGGGGFVSITNANSNASARADNSVWIAAGAQINASRNADVSASSFLQPYATASSNGGGFVSGVGGSVQATADYINVATVQGNVTAGNTATVEAHVNVNGVAGGSGDTGGAFTGGGITADVEIGDTDALNQVHLLGGGHVNGDFVVLNAQVDRLRMDAEANVSAGALGASTTANGNVNAFGASEVRLEPGSDVYGNVRIAINATYAGNDLFAAAVASCDCGGGDTEGHVNLNDNTDALVSGIAGSVLHTYDLEVNADQSSPGFGWDAESHGALIDVGGISVNGATNFGRDIYWESTVYLAPSPSPEITVNSNGTVTKLVNASLTDQFGNSYFVGSTFAAGRIIEVGDLVDSGSGIANFSTNDLTGFASFLASHNDDDVHFGAPPVGHIWGNDGVFVVEDAWDSITIMNSSSRTLVTHYIQVENTANPIATITVTVENIPGPTNSPPNDVSLDEFPPNRATI
ncbi:MAG: hypothetical protein ACXVPR_00475, partial [Actinomycetota bacterium]